MRDLDRLTPQDAPRGVAAAYRVQTALRDAAAAVALRVGWRPAALVHPGYAVPAADGRTAARVLGRIKAAPPGRGPVQRVGLPGWRRFLTVDLPDAPVAVDLPGAPDGGTTVRTDASGLLDEVVLLDLPPDAPRRLPVELRLPGRSPARGVVHAVPAGARTGVVCDVDDTVWITGLRQPLLAAWRTVAGSSASRHPVPGVAALLRALAGTAGDVPVVYLSNGSWKLDGPVVRFLARRGFPAGPLLMTDWGVTPERWFRDGQAHKRKALERLARELPDVRWVLVGDDGEHDPAVYRAFARDHPGAVAAVAIRQVERGARAAVDAEGDVPVVAAPDGHRLLALLREHGRVPVGR
jgi:phosphatidate phosphatase APP1